MQNSRSISLKTKKLFNFQNFGHFGEKRKEKRKRIANTIGCYHNSKKKKIANTKDCYHNSKKQYVHNTVR